MAPKRSNKYFIVTWNVFKIQIWRVQVTEIRNLELFHNNKQEKHSHSRFIVTPSLRHDVRRLERARNRPLENVYTPG